MECIFTVISNLVSKAQSPDDALAMADQIANKLTAQPIEKPAIRLKMYAIVHRLKGMC
jgi:translation initiation factor 3 subunit M